MSETSVAISGFGLPASEVTIAEVLKAAGYNTVHVGEREFPILLRQTRNRWCETRTFAQRKINPPFAPVALASACMLAVAAPSSAQSGAQIAYDAEYYVLEAQHREQWAADDKAVDAKLAAFREKNGGNPPNRGIHLTGVGVV